ncbi:MAG: sulfatase-like hydrolase/transferase [Calothrix sp. SM1_5_4]|nr:sulfatase-like hydrolase/transferase [Calothrix sp. SM1_5_4]
MSFADRVDHGDRGDRWLRTPKGEPALRLVIAVEGLGFETLNCEVDDGESSVEGFNAFCAESVRFTHAFAPSTMSQATMASLLTGLYPVDHQVRNNGGDFLSARYKTLAEVALSRKYRTFFVSGGPPIWRKSGLAQGFEIFDDNMEIEPGIYYRPAEEVFRQLMQWIDRDLGGQSFMAAAFLADLQFPEIMTRTSDGVIREKSAQGQLEEIGESLGGLVRFLKARKRWNSTNVVLVGLNSLSRFPTDEDPLPLSLRSDSVQVSLFIKPARKERDNPFQWTVDRDVSLVDVGHTMFHWLGGDAPSASLSQVQPRSLASALNKPEPNWKEDRLILTETAWPDWLEGGGVRWAIRQNQFLYIHDKRPLIFNTLTDRMESLPLRTNDPLWLSLNGDVMALIQRAQTLRSKECSHIGLSVWRWPASFGRSAGLRESPAARSLGPAGICGRPWRSAIGAR